ncbi:MAG: AlpA family phage regulatory protein [Halomonas sp.]|uniref:helix-turn-helix transcriptional regulator n=1 Tax=Halomonas sp. TaxID=1486246 RepID=UPI002ACE71F1|nr:AlpA family phage regulatory protein [Halomonas sp.]MDZ7852308.1 AlpA family phage regulatory protein [Halomonas sp.]
MDSFNGKVILRRKELERFIGFRRSQIYDMLNEKCDGYDPDFPKQIKLGRKAVGWYVHDVLKWIERRREQSNHDEEGKSNHDKEGKSNHDKEGKSNHDDEE